MAVSLEGIPTTVRFRIQGPYMRTVRVIDDFGSVKLKDESGPGMWDMGEPTRSRLTSGVRLHFLKSTGP